MTETSARTASVPGDWLCNGFVLGLAVWTLLANAAVALGLGLDALISGAATVSVAAAGLALWRHRRGAESSESDECDTSDPPAHDPSRDEAHGWTVGLLAGAACVAGIHAAGGPALAWWVPALAVAALALVWAIGRAPRRSARRRSGGSALVVLGLAFTMSGAVAVSHRSDADDAFYVNLVVAAMDDPSAPLLAGDTLHGVPGVPMSLPVFEVLSIHLLEASIGRLTGLPALTVAHRLMPPLIAFLIPFAYARLLALLLPGRWPGALLCSMGFLLLVGDGTLGFGDFALLRMQQGKAMMLHVALPLVAAAGIGFALRPGPRSWTLLAAAQIAAVGLSSSALWLAPVVAGLAVASGTSWPRAGANSGGAWRTLGLGALASFHPIGIALSMRAETERLFQGAVYKMETLSWSGEQLLGWSLESVFGDGPWSSLAIFTLLAGAAVAPTALGRRFMAIHAFAFVALFWNPFTSPFIAAHVSGPDTYFRVFWMLPMGCVVGAILSAPLEASPAGAPWPRFLAWASVGLLSLGALGWAATTPTLSAQNGVRLTSPGDKLPPSAFEAAREIARLAPHRETVLAPMSVARWLPLIHRHPYPLVVRDINLDILHDALGGEELERRRLLAFLVGGQLDVPDGARLLADAVDAYPLAVVCLGGRALGQAELRRVLLASALEVQFRSADYEVWARPAQSDP